LSVLEGEVRGVGGWSDSIKSFKKYSHFDF